MPMRKVIFSINTTLDGFFEGPHHELDWTVADGELHDFYADLLQGADLTLYGRVTYKLMLDYWPNAPSDPRATESEKHFADAINASRKIVYSKTLTQVGWNSELRRSFDPEEIRALKAEPGSYILVDGPMLARSFFQNNLVDEFIPVIHPAAIGRGTALFSGITDFPKLALQWSRRFESGAVVLSYHVDGKA